MNLKDFSLLKEDRMSYTVKHPAGHSLQIAKHGLSSKAQEFISKLKKEQHFDEGGTALDDDKKKTVGQIIGYPGMADGGEADDEEDDAGAGADGGAPPADAAPDSEATVEINPDAAASMPESLVNPNPGASPPPGAQTPTFAEDRPFGTPDTSQDATMSASAEQQASAQPAEETPAQAPSGAGYPDITGALTAEKGALGAGAAAEAQAGQAEAAAQANYQAQAAAEQKNFNDNWSAMQDQSKKFVDYLSNPQNNVNPNRFFQNMDTGTKIGAGIAMILGGVGGGLTGQGNPVVAMMQQAIERDIDAQKSNRGTVMNLYQMNQQNLGNTLQAHLATENQMYDVVKSKMLQAQAQAAGPEAQARIAPAIAMVDQQIAMNNFKRTAINGIASGQMSTTDPAKLVPLFIQNPDQQNKAFAEIKSIQNTKAVTPKIMQAFDDAAKFSASKATPGLESAGQKEFSALINTTVQETEGTARQAAFESIQKNMRPQFGDSAATLAKKRQATLDYLQSKMAAPVTLGASNGIIDLTKFQSTAPTRGPSPLEGKTATNARGQRIVMKNGQWVPYGG